MFHSNICISIHSLLGKIQASAKKTLVPKFKAIVQEGSVYEVENVLVRHNNPKYQTNRYRFKLNLMDQTNMVCDNVNLS